MNTVRQNCRVESFGKLVALDNRREVQGIMDSFNVKFALIVTDD